MHPATQKVRVDANTRPYDVLIGDGILSATGASAKDANFGTSCALVTDENVAPLCGRAVRASLEEAGIRAEEIVLPAGEETKSFTHLEEVLRSMIRAGLGRGSFVAALGGGVIGDLAGLAAALFYRGVPMLHIPTTVVSQVDSSVGGKTAIDVPEGKNLVGAFHQPNLVLADVATLRTLPERAWAEGFAEIIKHAAIRDPDLLDEVLRLDGREGADLVPLIARNVAIKARVVEEDEQETSGVRAHLNFGHTIGHAIETASGYGQLFHGEAVSLGTRAALFLSERRAGLDSASSERVLRALHRFSLPLQLDAKPSDDEILESLMRDKKFEDGKIRFVLVPELGRAELSSAVSLEDIREAIQFLRTPPSQVGNA